MNIKPGRCRVNEREGPEECVAVYWISPKKSMSSDRKMHEPPRNPEQRNASVQLHASDPALKLFIFSFTSRKLPLRGCCAPQTTNSATALAFWAKQIIPILDSQPSFLTTNAAASSSWEMTSIHFHFFMISWF